MRSETLETRQLLAANLFHNAAMPEDVNEDGKVSSIDALIIINQVSQQSHSEPNLHACQTDHREQRGRGRMTDVNNDGRDTPADALRVINLLMRQNRLEANEEDGSQTANDEMMAPDQEENVQGGLELTGDVVLDWNNLFGELLVIEQVRHNPGFASRSMAMLNLAIYDSVTLLQGHAADGFYNYDLAIDRNNRLDVEVVASQAAYTVLSSLYSDHQDMIDTARDQILHRATRPNDERPNDERPNDERPNDERPNDERPNDEHGPSLILGSEIGNAIVEARASDGFDRDLEYVYGDEPGNFQPDPLNPDVPVWGPAWGKVDTFSIESAGDFAPPPTPSLDSIEYADSYNEVLELGSVDSQTRTADQTEAGIFWAYDRTGMGTPMALFGDVLETISIQQGNTIAENAALFAQASVSIADAGVVAWQTKFDEQFWRPVTAIQAGDTDGNDLTEADPDWTALGAPDSGDDIVGFTPQFPTYVSGHATFGGALFGAIRDFYGTDDIAFDLASRELEIVMENPELEAAYGLDLDDAVRSFDSLTEAMAENGRSRVYLGIHFDFDDTVGQDVGQAVALSVASDFVVPNIECGEGSDHGRSGVPRGNEGRSRRPDPDPRPARLMRPDGFIIMQNDVARNPVDDVFAMDSDLVGEILNEDEIDLIAADLPRNSPETEVRRGDERRGQDRNETGDQVLAPLDSLNMV